jgi:hypothetical protein
MAATKSKSDIKPSTPKAAPKKAAPAAAKKPVTAKAPAKKAVAAKKPAAAKKANGSKAHKISPEERYRMVEVAAYFLAERNAFGGSPVEYWTAAEVQIAKLLKK